MNDAERDKLMTEMRFQLWGVSGTNGLVGDVKAIRRMVEKQERERQADKLEAQDEREADLEAARKEKKADRRWWVGTVLAVVMAIIAAASIVAGAI